MEDIAIRTLCKVIVDLPPVVGRLRNTHVTVTHQASPYTLLERRLTLHFIRS
jgi:hypothetical protein